MSKLGAQRCVGGCPTQRSSGADIKVTDMKGLHKIKAELENLISEAHEHRARINAQNQKNTDAKTGQKRPHSATAKEQPDQEMKMVDLPD